LLVAAVLTVAVTAAYCLRLWLMAFIGPRAVPVGGPALVGSVEAVQPVPHEGHLDSIGPREGALHAEAGSAAAVGADAAHDAPPAMSWVLVALAVPSAALGFFGLYSSGIPRWLGDVATAEVPGLVVLPAAEPALTPALATTVLSLAVAAVGLLVTYAVWRRAPARDPADALLARARPWVEDGYGVDEVYDRTLVRPTYAAARAVIFTDDNVVDGYVYGSGVGARFAGGVLRALQNGNVQTYLAGVLIGAVVIAFSVAVAVG
jgi:NADH-quinone oxidoreductase subunit L